MDTARQSAMEDIAGEPTLAAVFALWVERRGDTFAPSPNDFDMLAFPRHVLPDIAIVDVVDGGARFRFRLIGSGVATASGIDFTGKYVDEVLSGWMRDAVLDHYRAVTEQKRPGYAVAEFPRDGHRSVRNRRLVMPLSSDGVSVDRLLLASKVSSDWLLQDDLLDLALQSAPEVVRLFTML